MGDTAELNISLEPHLQDALRTVSPLIPKPIYEQLNPYIEVQSSSPTLPTIPYSLLQQISLWSRSPIGTDSLNSHEPPLSQYSYTMISLLAGTRTSPERKFPTYSPPDPHGDQKRAYNDKKAVTTVLNALLSIGGSGMAAWWAAEKTGWKPEWKVLLSLLVAVIVAASEAILYIIWESRRTAKNKRPTRRFSAKHKKRDGGQDVSSGSAALSLKGEIQQRPEGLRKRAVLTESNVG